MANYKGWDGYFKFGGEFVGNINSLSIDESQGEIDTSSFTSSTDESRTRTYEAGLKDVSASVSGFADLSDAGQDKLKASLNAGEKYYGYFFLETGTYFYGEGFVTSRTIDHSFDDNIAELSVDLRMSDTLEETDI